jgi:hypothetical protein
MIGKRCYSTLLSLVILAAVLAQPPPSLVVAAESTGSTIYLPMLTVANPRVGCFPILDIADFDIGMAYYPTDGNTVQFVGHTNMYSDPVCTNMTFRNDMTLIFSATSHLIWAEGEIEAEALCDSILSPGELWPTLTPGLYSCS